MTENGATNRLHFSGTRFWYRTCVTHFWDRIRLVPDSGAQYRTLFYSKPESGV